MRKFLFTLLALYTIGITIFFIILLTRGGRHAEPEALEEYVMTEAQCDSAVINAVRLHSTLYTAEAQSSKTMNYSEKNKVKLKILGIEKDMDVPFSKTEATIPVTVTYKAGIDLSGVTKEDNIFISQYPQDGTGGAIVITLPDPVLVQTAIQVDHENEKMKKELLAKGLTYEQYQTLIRQAKQEAWDDLSADDIRAIVETAKVSATEILLPQLRQLGYESIEIDFRQELDYSKIEKLKN